VNKALPWLGSMLILIMRFLSFLLAKLGEWMSSIDALEWLFLTIAPTEWDCPSVFLKTLLRPASCFPWGGFNMDSFFMGLHHDLRCILISLLFSCALSLFRWRSYFQVDYGSRFLWLCFFIFIIAGGFSHPVITWCDAGNASPPFTLPGEPPTDETPPAPAPEPVPVVIPQLAQPLLSVNKYTGRKDHFT